MKKPERVTESPELRAALRTLAEMDRTQAAPPIVEEQLLTAFRAARGTRPGPGSPPRWIWAAGVAAALLVLALAGIRRSSPPLQVAHISAPAALPHAPAVVPPAGTAPAPTVAKVAAIPARTRVRRSIRMPVPPVAPPAPGEDNAFIPLPYAAQIAPGEALDVVRVQVPRSAMMRFGLPISADRAWEPIRADLVVGQDGMMRAIRFVR